MQDSTRPLNYTLESEASGLQLETRLSLVDLQSADWRAKASGKLKTMFGLGLGQYFEVALKGGAGPGPVDLSLRRKGPEDGWEASGAAGGKEVSDVSTGATLTGSVGRQARLRKVIKGGLRVGSSRQGQQDKKLGSKFLIVNRITKEAN